VPRYQHDDFLSGYLTEATTVLFLQHSGGTKIEPLTLAQIEEDCAAFERDNEGDLSQVHSYTNDRFAGVDFYRDRNGHSGGFTDDVPEHAPDAMIEASERLQEAAKKYGTFKLVLDEDLDVLRGKWGLAQGVHPTAQAATVQVPPSQWDIHAYCAQRGFCVPVRNKYPVDPCM